MMGSYSGAGPRAAGAERRAYVRVSFHKPVTVSAPPDGPPVEARTIDISLGGVGLACRASFRKGQAVVVAFRLNDPKRGPVEERVAGRVANLVADEDGNRIGVEFAAPLHAASYPALTRAVERL